MNGAKGSIEINMPQISKGKAAEATKKSDEKFSCSTSCKNFILSVWEFSQFTSLSPALCVCEGATFNRGFNRALGSLLAGVLAISVAELALSDYSPLNHLVSNLWPVSDEYILVRRDTRTSCDMFLLTVSRPHIV